MKKLIIASILFPAIAFAQSVSINSLEVSGSHVDASGSASFTEELNSIQVKLDNIQTLLTSLQENWSVSFDTTPGAHTLTASVGSVSASRSFVVSNDEGQPLCQRNGECPFFGILGGGSSETSLRSGEGSCPAWFPFGCQK